MFVCLHIHEKLCIWPSHPTVPFCPSCYGDGGWICQCSVMATLSRVTADQYAVLSKEAAMRFMSEVCHECTDTQTNTESMSLSSSWRVNFPPSNSLYLISVAFTEACEQSCWFVIFESVCWLNIWALMRIDLLVPQEMCSLLFLYNTWYYWDIISNMIKIDVIVMIYFLKLKIKGSVSKQLLKKQYKHIEYKIL